MAAATSPIRAGPSSGNCATSLLLIDTIPTPRAWYSAERRTTSSATCLTYGQWLHRNMTSRAGHLAKSSRETRLPVVSGSWKSGAVAVSGSIVDAVAAMALPQVRTRCSESNRPSIQSASGSRDHAPPDRITADLGPLLRPVSYTHLRAHETVLDLV